MLDYALGISQGDMHEIVRRFTVEDIIDREIEGGALFGPWHQQWQRERAPEHVRRMLERAKNDVFLGARQTFTAMDAADVPPASFTAVANTVTESCLWCNPLATSLQLSVAPIPLGDMRAGKAYKVVFGGTISTTGTPTVIFTPRVGPNTTAANAANLSMGASPTITTVTGLSSHPVYGEFVMGVRSIALTAAGATTVGNGYVVFGNVSATATVAVMGGTVPTTVDNTVASGLLVNLTWGTASASNTLTCTWCAMRSLN